jgi:TPP-dependent pyruvate/acetoin dehydrogenase alpha subunit
VNAAPELEPGVFAPGWSPSAVLERLLLIRGLDERCVSLFASGEVRGTVHHASIGQEGSALGVAMHRRDGDQLLSTHRGVAHCLSWGADPLMLAAEMLGRRGGYAQGLGGHMHIIDAARGIAGTNGIVGAGLPMAVGAAYALQLTGPERACSVAFFGDGALNTGAVAEALNLAAVWKTPVLFVCENNGFAEMSHSAMLTAGSATERAAALGIAAERVSGDDVIDVARAAGSLFDVVRTGRPALLECVAFRAEGHWIGDPEHYRDPVEKASFADHDPVARFVATGLVPDDVVARLQGEVGATLDALFEEVMAMEPPELEDLYGHVIGS